MPVLTFTFTAPGLWEAQATTPDGSTVTARAYTNCDLPRCTCPKWGYEVRVNGHHLDSANGYPNLKEAIWAARGEASWILTPVL